MTNETFYNSKSELEIAKDRIKELEDDVSSAFTIGYLTGSGDSRDEIKRLEIESQELERQNELMKRENELLIDGVKTIELYALEKKRQNELMEVGIDFYPNEHNWENGEDYYGDTMAAVMNKDNGAYARSIQQQIKDKK